MTQDVGKPSLYRAQVRSKIMNFMVQNSGKRFQLEEVAKKIELEVSLVRHEAGLLASARYLNKLTPISGGTKLQYQYNDRCRVFDFENPEQALWGKGDLKGLKVWRVHPSALKDVTKDRLDEICNKYEPVEVY